mmetsp:Transcript_18289/g.30316  ORF Transcript_18289/g.30316 Transcript_18289/m.30316 type:complete len:810 (+) Transcript_18289:161-2590(+)
MACALDREHLLLLALVSHDLGWISFMPSVGLPAMLIALFFQICIMLSHCKSRDFILANEVAVFFWIMGSEVWTFSEYMWDNGIPAGILDEFEVLRTLDVRWYPIVMTLAVSLMVCTGVALLAVHLLRCICARRVAAASQGRALLESQNEAESKQRDVCRCFPLHVYETLFLLPWIMSDTTWAFCNLLDTFSYEMPGALVYFSAVTGLVSIVIQADLVRRHIAERDGADATICVAELLWVAGNVVWMIQDVVMAGDCRPAYLTALGLFMTSWMLTAAITLISSWPRASFSRLRNQCPRFSVRLLVPEAVDVSTVDASSISTSDTTQERLESGLLNLNASPAPLLACEALNVTTMPEQPEDVKKPRSRPRKRTSKLMRDVAVLARRLPECDFVKVAAGLALRALGDPDKPIIILNIGQVGRRLEEWRSRLPRVLPRYAVRHHADKKVLHLLREGHCSFECAAMSEVDLMLAHGVPSEDLFFSTPCKTRSQLGFIREKGVLLMPFDNAGELRKVAADHPGARLLLQISGEDSEHSAARRQPRNMLARFGAVRSDWEPLLDLAAELRLQVVGISLAAGYGSEESSHFEKVLMDAHVAFKLGTERGFDMSILDLGENLFADLGSKTNVCSIFVEKALQLNGLLSSVFPTEVFPQLQVSAEVGSFLAHDAIALLTKVIEKTVNEPHLDQPASTDGNESSSQLIQYLLNDNLGVPYSRPRLLDGKSDIVPEVLGDDAGQPRHCCMMSPGATSSVVAEMTIPEVEKDEWLLWRGVGNHLLVPGMKRQTSNSGNGRTSEPSRPAQVCVWYYAEEEVVP